MLHQKSGEANKEIRTDKEVAKQKIADAIGISQKTVSNSENTTISKITNGCIESDSQQEKIEEKSK